MLDNSHSEPADHQPIRELFIFYKDKYTQHRCYLGLVFQQGKRTVIQINVPANDIPNLLQTKPATKNDPDLGKDRPEIRGHAEEIRDYLVERLNEDKPWILGTITVNVAPELLSVIELGLGLCVIVIPNDVKLDLTDGQHRKIAIENITKSGDLLQNDSFPITIILERNLRQCQSDFRDIAQAKPVDNSLLLSFGESVGVIGIAKRLIENVSMFQGKTDKVNKSPRKNTKLIYTIKYIATLVSCLFTGNPNEQLKDYNVEQSATKLTNYLNIFFSECEQTRYICETRVENLTLEEVQEFKRHCLLGVSIGIQILGRLLHHAYDPNSNKINENMLLELTQLDWSRGNSLWHSNVVRINSKGKKGSRTYISFGAAAVADAVRMAKIQLGW